MLYNFPPFLSSLNHVLDSCDTTFPLPFLFEPRPRFMLYNFSHYFPPFLSSLNHVLDSWYSTFPTTFLFDPTPRFECRSGKSPHAARANACGISKLYLKVLGVWFGGRPDAVRPTLCTAAMKKGSEALPRRRWVKVNSCAGSGFPPSPTATTLSLLPFPADRSYWLFDQQ